MKSEGPAFLGAVTMRPDRDDRRGQKSFGSVSLEGSIPLHGMAFGAMGPVPNPQWVEIYRVAYERTVEALRPTRYDRAMAALAN